MEQKHKKHKKHKANKRTRGWRLFQYRKGMSFFVLAAYALYSAP